MGPARVAAAGIAVVAGVLIDAAGRVLLAQRPPGKHLAGGWEFPGGKRLPGEERAAALRRELSEELGIELDACRPLIQLEHDYPDRRIALDVWCVTSYRGEPVGREGQALRWVARDALHAPELLAADRPVITALRLPECLNVALTSLYRIARADSRSGPGRSSAPRLEGQISAPQLEGLWCETVAGALGHAADFIVTAPGLEAAELARLCAQVNLPVYAAGADLEAAAALGASGIHHLERPHEDPA